MASASRQYLNEQRGRCEGLNDSIRLGLRRLRRDTVVEDDPQKVAFMGGTLAGLEEQLRVIDQRLWQTLDDLGVKG